ncbi:MAG: exonuclease domain-containing protein [Porphyromonas sp.]|nr:exonuclease domain-containing protein [Porphyromonas sp.]
MSEQHPQLHLERPIVFFDLETTGTNPQRDRIIEFSFLKIHPDGKEEVLNSYVNPEIPIPAESTEVHGITDEDVASAPTFAIIGKEVAAFIENSDLAGYNCSRFDIPLLAEEFLRAEIPVDLRTNRRVVDVQTIFHKREQRTLVAAYDFYCDKVLEEAHSAEADTRATYEVLRGQLYKYQDLPNDVKALDAYTHFTRNVDYAGRFVYDENDVEVFNFGKHKGRPVMEVLRREPSYYNWMMESDFPRDTKHQLTRIKMRLDNQSVTEHH